MNKIMAAVLVLGLVFFFIINANPPLQSDTVTYTDDQQSVVISLANGGLASVHLTEVTVNNDEAPQEVKLQVNPPTRGFVLTKDYTSEETKGFRFVELTEMKVKKGVPSTDEAYEDNEKIYGVSALHNEPINSITIHYTYFGMQFDVTVDIP